MNTQRRKARNVLNTGSEQRATMAGVANPSEIAELLMHRYRVEELLGEGARGRVYKAYDTQLMRIVAIKTLKRGLAATQPTQFRAVEAQFVREAEIGALVGDHPNLVDAYDFALDSDGTGVLILEYVSGGTLCARIAHGAISLADALRLTADAARGLQAAHEKGLVHCDIKPTNIYCAVDGRAQVGDFGSAHIEKRGEGADTPATHARTPLYMSPEQRQMTEQPHPASDQYSLGLVLYELVTGQMYKGMREAEAAQLMTDQPEPVVTLFRRMSAARPDDRFPSMETVVSAITEVEGQLTAA